MICDPVQRRSFLTLLVGAAAAWPLAAGAQQRAMPVIGYLSSDTSGSYVEQAFHQGLSQAGYVEGRNVSIEYHWSDYQNNRLPALAAEFVRRQVSVIVASNLPATQAAKAATTTIPIVFQVGVDPVLHGLATSLSRPSGNLTGVTSLSEELTVKLLEVMHDAVPAATAMAAILSSPDGPSQKIVANNLQASAKLLGLQLHIMYATSESDINANFARLAELRPEALVVAPNAINFSNRQKIAELALRQSIPTIGFNRAFALAGGLMSYGNDNREGPRIAGLYTGRILKGEKPADLPVQQATRIELIINTKTAKALGLTFPITLLGRADEVIE